MLFQPTNIVPSSFAGVGGDLVDATEGMTISWQVNGTSPLYGYRIVFYANDSASTVLYTTLKEDVSPPFYGVDGNGNPQLFSATIDAATLAAAGIVNGNASGYKYKIHQWYGPNSSDVTRQYGENFFICQANPTVAITTTEISLPDEHLTGTWSQSDGVGMDWVRWVISLYNEQNTIVHDSGIIHTQTLDYDFGGWVAPEAYYVTLYYQMQNGYSGSVSKRINSLWASERTDGIAKASLVNGCTDVLITYPNPTAMLRTAGNAIPQDGVLPIGDNDTVTWTGQNLAGQRTTSGIVWCGIPRGTVTVSADGYIKDNNTVYDNLTVTIRLNGYITATITGEGGTVTETIALVGSLSDKIVTVIVGGDTWYVVVKTLGSVYVNDDTQMLPNTDRIVSINGTGMVLDTGTTNIVVNNQNYDLTLPMSTDTYTTQNQFSGVFSTGPAMSFSLSGEQECYFAGLLNGVPDETLLEYLLAGNTEAPDFDYNWLAITNFTNTTLYQSMGTIWLVDGSEYPYLAFDCVTIYRIESGTSIKETLFTTSDTSDMVKIVDCSAKNGVTYSYIVAYQMNYNEGADHLTAAMTTNSITPCGWDWILTTAAPDANGLYHMTGEYRFGLDVSTDAISNNNMPNLLQNFTKYPTRQGVSANYRSGSLTAFIGSVDYNENVYVDTAAQSAAILAISNSTDAKFLRTRKGERWMVDTGAAVTMQVGDKYKEQPYKAGLPWVETGDAEGVPVVSVPSDAAWYL